MSRLEDRLLEAVKATGVKPPDSALREPKQNWNQRLSDNLAHAIAAELRDRGMDTVLPAEPGQVGVPVAQAGVEREP